MNTIYAGIGSRETPEEIVKVMKALAVSLRMSGWTLRSGHAPGADQAFEWGAAYKAEVYLPWPRYEAHVPVYAEYSLPYPSDQAIEMAEKFHPGWAILSQGAKKLHARNCHQLLGADLLTPAEAVVCWTANGSLTGSERSTGGTGQALRIAHKASIKVFNLALPEHLRWAYRLLRWS